LQFQATTEATTVRSPRSALAIAAPVVSTMVARDELLFPSAAMRTYHRKSKSLRDGIGPERMSAECWSLVLPVASEPGSRQVAESAIVEKETTG